MTGPRSQSNLFCCSTCHRSFRRRKDIAQNKCITTCPQHSHRWLDLKWNLQPEHHSLNGSLPSMCVRVWGNTAKWSGYRPGNIMGTWLVAWCYWGSKRSVALVSIVVLGLLWNFWVLQPLSMRPGQSSCRLLVRFAFTDSSAWVVHKHPSAGSLGNNSCVSHGCCKLCFSFLYVSVCVVFVCVV